MKPQITLYNNGFKAIFKKKDFKMVVATLKGEDFNEANVEKENR